MAIVENNNIESAHPKKFVVSFFGGILLAVLYLAGCPKFLLSEIPTRLVMWVMLGIVPLPVYLGLRKGAHPKSFSFRLAEIASNFFMGLAGLLFAVGLAAGWVGQPPALLIICPSLVVLAFLSSAAPVMGVEFREWCHNR